GLPKGSYIACDYETGSGNNIYGGKTPTANAIIAFMDTIKNAGYKPLLYASSSVLQNNIDTNSVIAKYPNSLWVASYAISGRIDSPNFNYFPSMNGVSIWQFTDNWKGLSVDGNIAVLPLSIDGNVTSNNGAISQAPATSNTNSASSSNASSNTSLKRWHSAEAIIQLSYLNFVRREPSPNVSGVSSMNMARLLTASPRLDCSSRTYTKYPTYLLLLVVPERLKQLKLICLMRLIKPG